jgi:hydroxymethylpyrimidine/phosphomethylpyrimidine kinase
VLDGFPVAAAKTGMLWSAGVVELVAGLCRGGRVRWWVVDPVMVARLAGVNTHGSGCMLAAAITALLARGLELPAACERGLDFVHAAMRRPHDVAGVARLAGIETAG